MEIRTIKLGEIETLKCCESESESDDDRRNEREFERYGSLVPGLKITCKGIYIPSNFSGFTEQIGRAHV